MTMPKNYDRQDVLNAIEGSGGVTLTVASRLGCAWHTAEKYIQMWESTKQAFADEDNKTLDRAESVIRRNIDLALKTQQETMRPVDSGDAKWVLSRKGKDRGWAERHELRHEGTGSKGEIEIKQVGLTDAERKAALDAMLGKR